MKHGILSAAALAVLLSAGAAQAQTTIVTEPAQPRVVVTGPAPPLVLTPVQRETIYRTIVRTPPQRTVTVGQAPTVTYRVGARVPQNVTLYPVPQEVVAEVPAVRNYRYMVINDRAWLVDPATSEIVAEVGD